MRGHHFEVFLVCFALALGWPLLAVNGLPVGSPIRGNVNVCSSVTLQGSIANSTGLCLLTSFEGITLDVLGAIEQLTGVIALGNSQIINATIIAFSSAVDNGTNNFEIIANFLANLKLNVRALGGSIPPLLRLRLLGSISKLQTFLTTNSGALLDFLTLKPLITKGLLIQILESLLELVQQFIGTLLGGLQGVISGQAPGSQLALLAQQFNGLLASGQLNQTIGLIVAQNLQAGNTDGVTFEEAIEALKHLLRPAPGSPRSPPRILSAITGLANNLVTSLEQSLFNFLNLLSTSLGGALGGSGGGSVGLGGSVGIGAGAGGSGGGGLIGSLLG